MADFEDITPLPIQDHDPSDSDHDSINEDELAHYVVRITAYDKFTFEQLHQRIEEEYQILRYVIAQEVTPQVHYHLVLTTDKSLKVQDIKDIIRAFITPLWVEVDPETKIIQKLPRGFGNKQYNCQIAENVHNAIVYSLKSRGTYKFANYTQEYIEQCISESFVKPKTSNFTTELQQLKDQFQSSDMDILEFMTKFTQLKSKFDQLVNVHHAYQTGLSQLIKRDPTQAEIIVTNFLYKL